MFSNTRLFGLIVMVAIAFGFTDRVYQQADDPEGGFHVPPEIEQAMEEWPLANRDYNNSRATFDANINASNVHLLDVAWTMDITGIGPFGGAASNPLITNGVVYFQDLASNVFALDFESGEVLWSQMYNAGVIGPNGPGIGDGKLFTSASTDEIVALDLATGEELWSNSVGPEKITGTNQPVVFDGVVYFGTQVGNGGEGDEQYLGYDGGRSGYVLALDPDSGEIQWEFQVVEEGFWGNPELNSGGGLWYPPGIDTETGMTFWGTGNPAPFPGTVDFPNATSRPGPNLYTNTMLAFEHPGGELLWYNQVRPHDLFDLDFQLSPILATTTIDDEDREIVIGSGKLGVVYAFDRATGETLWGTEVGVHQNDDVEEIPPDTVLFVYPGQLGGVETPMSMADGVVYVLVGNNGTPYTQDGWGAETGSESVPRQDGRMSLREGTSEVIAIDIATGEIQWITEFDTLAYGGTTVVNDLVFTATMDGRIYALLREDGSIVWEYNAPGGIIAWPAVAGDTYIIPVGIGSRPVLLALRLQAESAVPTPDQQRTPVATEAN